MANKRRVVTREDITPSTLTLIRTHVSKLNRQIGRLKLNLTLITLTITREFTITRRRNGVNVNLPRLDISLDTPDIESLITPGYSLVAIVKSAIDGEDTQRASHRIITRFDNDEYDLSSYRTDTLVCAECGKSRRRNTVLILLDSNTDELVTLGTDCAEKYLPRASNSVNILDNLTHFDTIASDGDEFDYDFDSKGSHKPTFERDSILLLAAIWTAHHEYIRASEGGSTKGDILAIMFDRGEYGQALRREYKELCESELYDKDGNSKWDHWKTWCANLVEWSSSTHGSDYFLNLAAALAGGPVSLRTLGLVVSAPSVYRRHLGQAKLKEQKEASLPPQSLPPTGRNTITGKVISSKVKCTNYGEQLKMLVEVVNGTRYRLWGSVPASIRRALYDLDKDSSIDTDAETLTGCEVEFDATITPKECGFGFYSRPSKARVVSWS